MEQLPIPPEGELIEAARKRMHPRVTVREAARRTGISEGWWRQIVKGAQPVSGGGRVHLRGTAETVARMARVVGVTPEQLVAVGREDAAEELRSLRGRPPASAAADDPASERRRIAQQVAEEMAADIQSGLEEAIMQALEQAEKGEPPEGRSG